MTPRSPESPARKKARVWKAWAVTNCAYRFLFDECGHAEIHRLKPDANEYVDDARIFQVEIREIIPAPVPPRSRKGGSR